MPDGEDRGWERSVESSASGSPVMKGTGTIRRTPEPQGRGCGPVTNGLLDEEGSDAPRTGPRTSSISGRHNLIRVKSKKLLTHPSWRRCRSNRSHAVLNGVKKSWPSSSPALYTPTESELNAQIAAPDCRVQAPKPILRGGLAQNNYGKYSRPSCGETGVTVKGIWGL